MMDAAQELRRLLGHRRVAERWPDGAALDDVLDELRALGAVDIRVRDDGDAEFMVRLVLRGEAEPLFECYAKSLHAALIRAVLTAENELQLQAEAGVEVLEAWLAQRAKRRP